VFAFEWSVLGGYGVSDHHPIKVGITHTMIVSGVTANANWSLHEVLVREESTQVDINSAGCVRE